MRRKPDVPRPPEPDPTEERTSQSQPTAQEEENREPDDSFASVIQSVEDLPVAEEEVQADTPPEPTARTPGANTSLPMSISEIDAVRRQIERCWNIPVGARDARDLVVRIQVDMAPDGIPKAATIVDQDRLRTDGFFRIAAEAAQRAVLNQRCHPFRFPADKYERWKTLTLVFDPKDMLSP